MKNECRLMTQLRSLEGAVGRNRDRQIFGNGRAELGATAR
jgi:hypothetical protein